MLAERIRLSEGQTQPLYFLNFLKLVSVVSFYQKKHCWLIDADVALDEMATDLSKWTRTKYACLHRDEIKKRSHQILKFKTQPFHILPLYVLSLFFIPSRSSLSYLAP